MTWQSANKDSCQVTLNFLVLSIHADSHPAPLRSRVHLPVTLSDRHGQAHDSGCRGTGYNAFDTMRSPGYQGHESCQSCQQSVVGNHDHVPSVSLSLSPFPLPQRLSAFLAPSRGDEHPLDPWRAGRFGRLAIQSPVTGHESNAIFEISTPEVTPFHSPSRRTSFCTENDSGEDATPTPVSSEVDERQGIRRQSIRKLIHWKKCVKPISHNRKPSRNPRSEQETIPQVQEYGLNIMKLEISKNSEQMKQPKENRKPFQKNL